MSFRTGERKDGSKYHYPVGEGNTYNERDLEPVKINNNFDENFSNRLERWEKGSKFEGVTHPGYIVEENAPIEMILENGGEFITDPEDDAGIVYDPSGIWNRYIEYFTRKYPDIEKKYYFTLTSPHFYVYYPNLDEADDYDAGSARNITKERYERLKSKFLANGGEYVRAGDMTRKR